MGFLGSGVWFSVNEVKDGGRERYHGGGREMPQISNKSNEIVSRPPPPPIYPFKVGVGLKVATSFSPVLVGGLTPPFRT